MTKKVVSPPTEAASPEPVAAPMPLLAYEIPVELIDPNPEQPRVVFDEEGLKGLAQSIKENGVIEPIVVEQTPENRFILHDGERRLRAAKMAGLATIPAFVHPLPLDDVARRARLVRALVANVQRTDLNPIEEARAYARMHDELGMTDQQIADQVGGKSRSYVANKRRLLELPENVQTVVIKGGLSERQAMALLPLFQLPASVREAAEHTWCKPSSLLKNAHDMSSDDIRERINRMVEETTKSVHGLQFAHHSFEGLAKVQAACCDTCPARIQIGNDQRCPDAACRQIKDRQWEAVYLAAASAAIGIPPAEGALKYDQYTAPPTDLLSKLVTKKCENLRLTYSNYGGGILTEYPYARLICLHGAGGRCTCSSSMKAQETRNDPEHIAERTRVKQLEKEIVAPAVKALTAAITEGHTGVWRAMMASLSYELRNKGEDWDLATIQQRIALSMVNNQLGYKPQNNLPGAQVSMQKLFTAMGIALPAGNGKNIGVDILHRLDRIDNWMANLAQEFPKAEAIQGNLDNLTRMALELRDPDLNGEMAGEELVEIGAQIAGMINTLKLVQVVVQEWQGMEEVDFERVNPLITLYAFDEIFQMHLEAASPQAIRYALALLTPQEEDCPEECAALRARLQVLESNGHEPVSVQTPAEEGATA